MAKLTSNQKIVAGTIDQLGVAPVTDEKLWDNTYLNFIGTQILAASDMRNKFFNCMVNKISKMYLTSNRYQNKLATFKKDAMPMGVAIEDIYVNFQNPTDYDTTSSLMEDSFKDDIIAVYYTANSYKKYYATTSMDAFTQAFNSWGDMDKFINAIINKLYDSQQLYEWNKTKQLLGNDFNQSVSTMVKQQFEYYANTYSQDLTKLIRSNALSMQCPSSSYNNFRAYAVANGFTNTTSSPVVTYSSADTLNLIIRNEAIADIDVDVLSVAFNLDKVSFMGKVHAVDNFGITENHTTGTGADTKTYTKIYDYTNSSNVTVNVYDITKYRMTINDVVHEYTLIAVLCDDSFVHIHDVKEPMLVPFFNPSNLITTTYLHSWQVYGLCPFANAVGIYTDTVIN